MAGCGYVCPQCEGKGWVEIGEACNWCSPVVENKAEISPVEISTEEWIEKVHGNCACSDIGIQE